MARKHFSAADLVAEAEAFARAAHVGQVRKFTGLPYITHPEAVAAALDTCEEKAVAWLHDVVEDTDVTMEQLERIFPPDIVHAVDSVTKRDGEPYLTFILRSYASPVGRRVKIADIEHNMSDLPKRMKDKMDKYQLALHILNQHPPP